MLQEDADAVGLSILSGAHMTLVPRIATLLKSEGAEDVVLVLGGTIPNDDIAELKELGVAEVFTPGAPVQGIIDYISSRSRPSGAGRPAASTGALSSSAIFTAPPAVGDRSSPSSSAHSRSMSANWRRPLRQPSSPRGVS